MRRIRARALAPVLLALALAACATSGAMTGRLTAPGIASRPITLAYDLDRTGDGTLTVALPGGESFTGPLVRVRTAAGIASAPGIDLDFSTIDWGRAADRWTFGRDDADKMVALLQGDRGGVMRCRFTLLYPPGGLRDGGTGECQSNAGERIDVRF